MMARPYYFKCLFRIVHIFQSNARRPTGLVTSRIGISFENTLLKEREREGYKWRKGRKKM